MSYVMYNNQRIIPAPFVSITKQYNMTGDGTKIGKTYTITVTGDIIPNMGSPTSSGTFHTGTGYPANETIGDTSRLAAILRKQEALRELFATDGRWFEVQSLDATTPMKCNPRIISINFPEGQWYTRCPYTIEMEADEMYPKQEDTFSAYISSSTETWSLETDEGQAEGFGDLSRTYRLSHSVGATGKRFYDDDQDLQKQAWEAARDYVVPRLGFDATIVLSSGVSQLPAYYGGYNHYRSENIDKAGGSYEVTENWIITSGTALEEYNIQQSRGDDTYNKVSVDGTITGLEQRNASTMVVSATKYANALTRFTAVSGIAYSRAQTYSGLTLNIVPVRETIGRNVVGGTINYSYEFDDRPTLITGAKTANVQVLDNLLSQMSAQVFVLGRASGPVLQDLSTSAARKRSLSIDILMGSSDWGNKTLANIRSVLNNNPRAVEPTKAEINNIIEAASPSGLYTTYFRENPQETWNPLTGQYSYSVEWTYE